MSYSNEKEAFLERWKKIEEKIDQYNTDNVDETIQLARINKVFFYIQETVQNIDPDLTPKTLWAQCNTYITQIENYYNAAKPAISNVNNALDQILTYISPFIIPGKNAAKAAGHAFSQYEKVILNAAKTLKGEIKELHEEAQKNRDEIKEYTAESKTSKDNILEYEKELLQGTDEDDSIKSAIEAAHKSIDSIHDYILSYHAELKVGNEEEPAIIYQINQAKKASEDDQKLISGLLLNSKNEVSKLKQFYIKIYGAEDEKGSITGGLDNDIENKIQALEYYKKTQEDIHKTLKEEIERLLPGATSAGMSKTFNEKAKELKKPIRNNNFIFYTLMVLLVLFSIPKVISKIYGVEVDFNTLSEWRSIFSNVAYRLPLITPVIWLAYFVSKRRSETFRLREEYLHKAAVAESYHSFKTQIEAIGSDDGKILEDLIKIGVHTIALNPAKTLDKKHGEPYPLVENIEVLNTIAPHLGKTNEK